MHSLRVKDSKNRTWGDLQCYPNKVWTQKVQTLPGRPAQQDTDVVPGTELTHRHEDVSCSWDQLTQSPRMLSACSTSCLHLRPISKGFQHLLAQASKAEGNTMFPPTPPKRDLPVHHCNLMGKEYRCHGSFVVFSRGGKYRIRLKVDKKINKQKARNPF